MSTVIGVHELEILPGVSAEEFEQFVREQLVPAQSELPGLNASVYKGERGARAGHYLIVFTFESAAARDTIFPATDQPSEEAQRWFEAHAAMWQRWEQLTTPLGGSAFTDYIEVSG